MNAVKHFVQRVRKEARPKEREVQFRVFGRERVFCGYDWGSDTFILEKNVWKNMEKRAPVLIVRKSDLLKGAHGVIFVLTHGNHNVATVPLITGAFWNLGSVPERLRSAVLSRKFICANIVNGHIEISQREVDSERIADADAWLQSLGFRLDEIIFADRNPQILERYRSLGQEWRIRPLAWTSAEMVAALNASRTTINSFLRYYHSSGGVHFLAYSGFHELLERVDSEFDLCLCALKEMVAVYKGQRQSNMRTVKRNNHHEIELFGLRLGAAETFVVPELERLLAEIESGKIAQHEIKVRLLEICYVIRQCLDRPELADENSPEFIETMYMHLSGEIYQIDSVGISSAFDARRTALPGATFRGNRPDFHPGADRRSRVLIYNIQQMLSSGERIEDANVYEVRDRELDARAETRTREIVFKTNRRPLRSSMIEKGLAQRKSGYGDYLLARVHAFRSLGIDIGEYRLLSRLDSSGVHRMNYFLRQRCPGEPLEIAAADSSLRRKQGGRFRGADIGFVKALTALLGSAAAQNMVMKKFIPPLQTCRFGVGKEIFEVGYDAQTGRELPVSVMICSVRGTLGWKNCSLTSSNITHVFDFYLGEFAQVLAAFAHGHVNTVAPRECAEIFFNGFASKTHEMYWRYASNRDAFESFDPHLPKNFFFARKWRFALWALEQQQRQLKELREAFMEKTTLFSER
jgi:hypothetical protein